ncbi:hypothetical protein PSTG_10130 [Puccinia striiformis f. sp. tritici PST-78]|uniref:Uncharacterized protein n=1 Tax=Puccinia striiformis f. sp. tritici PST-78 TaxID=1165861 RepID=A0A0L0VB86_9BASI|nr:hypothetical protein PSTG_10130 [Puccinia striiformis f. sp. tritici PST-78]
MSFGEPSEIPFPAAEQGKQVRDPLAKVDSSSENSSRETCSLGKRKAPGEHAKKELLTAEETYARLLPCCLVQLLIFLKSFLTSSSSSHPSLSAPNQPVSLPLVPGLSTHSREEVSQLPSKVLQATTFFNACYYVAFLVAAFSFGVHAATVKPSLSARQAAIASSSSSTQSVFQQQASFSVVYESVQTLYQSYQSAFNQYQSCSSCNTALAQSGFQTQFQQSVTQMYSSYQSIMTTSQQFYASRYQSQLLPIFQQMSFFGSFTQTIAASPGVDLKAILGSIGLQVDLFANIGLDLTGSLGGSSRGGLLSGVLGGGRKSGGLLAGLLAGLLG